MSGAVAGAGLRRSFEPGSSTVICVLGMSRSGTSLTARLLGLAGVFLGSDEELLGGDLRQLAGEGEETLARAREANPGGFFEHYRVTRLNERILRAFGGSWREPPSLPSGWERDDRLSAERDEARALIAQSFSGHEQWAWKDPRNSLTLPFWQALIPEMRYVICIRNPLDVARSLERRDGIAIEQGLDLWRTYVASALANTAGCPRLLLAYESYFRDRDRTVSRLACFAGREGAFDGEAERAVAEAVDERLWRNQASREETVDACDASPGVAPLYLLTEAMAVGAEGPRPLAARIRARLGPPPELPDWPLVSIVVLNRDGLACLPRLLAGLSEHTDYPRLELIMVDNASSDGSLEFIRRVEAPFPITIVANPYNESFSTGCNQGAEMASGDLLLFLNNDTEAFEDGWLRELVACQRRSGAGAVAATLLCRDEEHRLSFEHGYGVAHRGLALQEEAGTIRPVLHGWEADPLDEELGRDAEGDAMSAACLLVAREAFERVDGFSSGYIYGVEDVDLCLELRTAGHGIVCSGRSLHIHHPVSTRRRTPFEEERARKIANQAVLWERWGPRLRREYELDRCDGDDAWPLGFCIKAAGPAPAPSLDALAAELKRLGHPTLLLEGDRAEDPAGLNYDVALHLRGDVRYVPKSGQLNVLWDVVGGEGPGATERSRYDLVLAGDDARDLSAERIVAAVEARIPEVGYRLRIGEGGGA